MDFRENSNRNIGTYSDHLPLCYAIICEGELLPPVGWQAGLLRGELHVS
jgi:hypothetical protein